MSFAKMMLGKLSSDEEEPVLFIKGKCNKFDDVSIESTD
jgi:hypothetical protein